MRFKFLGPLLVLSFAQNLVAQKKTQSLTEFRQTEFVATLENEIHTNKNAVYCPTLLLAWDELRTKLGGSIKVDSLSHDLYLFNRSKAFENTLLKSDYSVSSKIDGNSIRVKAELKKSLPLVEPMTSYEHELIFDGKKVPSFGKRGVGKGSAGIRYYNGDNNVIVSLTLENPWHELLLFKTDSIFPTIGAAVNALQQNLSTVTLETLHGKGWWKYGFGENDQLIIPKIKFDIKTNYPTMEGKMMTSGGVPLEIGEISQRTAFVLDENGAKVESEGTGEVVFEEPVQSEEPRPKKIIFDKPFFIFIKRRESTNPYLILWIANSDLMR